MNKCDNCHEREGTLKWVGDAMDLVHGAYSMWCELCVVEAQIDYAQKAAERLPNLLATKERLSHD